MYAKKITIDDIKNMKVLLRADFNVPMQDGVIQDLARIKHVAPTIEFLKKAGSKIILASHWGKPSGYEEKLSLKYLIPAIADIYNINVVFVDDCLKANASEIIDAASPDDLILLENLRFYREEENCNDYFAKKIASLADFYINDAFSTSHRNHASICAIPKFLPHAFGLAFMNEWRMLDYFFHNAPAPRMSIVGGSKLSTKINLLKNLVKKVNKLALGGGIAGAFLAYYGNDSLKMFRHEEYRNDMMEILGNAQEYGCELILPVDFSALIHKHDYDDRTIIYSGNDKTSVFDIGPESVELFRKHIRESATVLWNGPLGLFEKTPFDFGTMSVAQEIATRSREGKLTSIIGGGDTAFAMSKFGIDQDLTYKSTSGGAFLTYLEGNSLPGITAMENPMTLVN
ncbi:MAG: phosphoglycerate kinase [Holosporaceae bacterium]|jgi:phosphoglycerate kinase|nr:phosphoglycerate kinase [Holosporaceae bacterium]